VEECKALHPGVSPTLAKALLLEVKPKVDHIRAILKDRKKKQDVLVVGGLAGPPAPDKDEKSPEGQGLTLVNFKPFVLTPTQVSPLPD